MTTSFHRFMLELAAIKKGTGRDEVALLVQPPSWGNPAQLLAAAKSTTRTTRPLTGFAVVNLIQSWMAGRTPPNSPLWVYTTALPNEAERGMTRLQLRNSHIFYLRSTVDARLRWYHATRKSPKYDKGTWAPPDHLMKFGVKSYGKFVNDPWTAIVDKRKTDSASTWLGKVKNKRYGNQNYKPWADLSTFAKSMAIAVERKTLATGRAEISRDLFSVPLGYKNLAIAKQLKGDARKSFFSLLVQELVHATQDRNDQDGHNIGSLLVSSKGEILAWAVNTNRDNKTYHGEVNLIQAYERQRGPVPKWTTLYTSLEPCEMCSGMLVESVTDNKTLRVIYVQADDTLAQVYTALKRQSPKVSQKAATVEHSQGKTYTKVLRQAQTDLFTRVHPRFKAPTAFLHEYEALDVFAKAGRQRKGLSTPVAKELGEETMRANRWEELDRRKHLSTAPQARKVLEGKRRSLDDDILIDLRSAKQDSPKQKLERMRQTFRDDTFIGYEQTARFQRQSARFKALRDYLDALQKGQGTLFRFIEKWTGNQGKKISTQEHKKHLDQVKGFLRHVASKV